MSSVTYVLVHGGWSGAWIWRDLGAELSRRGVAWTSLDLPSSTHGASPHTYLADDAREVIEVANLEGPVVLVGHSYGGSVITEAADRIHRLERLVYVAAFVPLLGQSTTAASAEVHELTELDRAIEVEGKHLRLNPQLARHALFNDCSNEVATWALSQLSTQTIASFRSPRTSFDISVPSFYVACSLDRAVPLSVQLLMAGRCDKVATLESGHSPMLTNPSALCDLLLVA